jgi:hypothetical protein
MTPEQAYYKCLKNNKRDEQLEKIIITDPYCAYYYSRDIIKGRWTEAEDIISTSPYYTYLYARDIIEGKLPENMHNAMILHALRENSSEDLWTGEYFAKGYFEFIK